MERVQNITCDYLPSATSGSATVGGLVKQNSDVPWLVGVVSYCLNAEMMSPVPHSVTAMSSYTEMWE